MKPVPAIFGAVVGLVVGGLVAGGAYVAVRRSETTVRLGWNLVPVVVAASDLPAGHSLTMEDISSRAVPEQFVTSSVVKPDSASYVLGMPLLVPWHAGEPLIWAAVVTPGAECGPRVEQAAKQLGASATAATWELVGAVKQAHPKKKATGPEEPH